MNKESYLNEFASEEKQEIDSKHVEAFRLAIDNRKFEIELYWKRATYFWTFIAVTFAGYVLIQRIPDEDRGSIDFFLSCFGFILSLGWFLANKGSKKWQENWESHVDHLENKVSGPLYKLVFYRSNSTKKSNGLKSAFMGPGGYSVSKINQLISLYVVFIWSVLMLYSQTIFNTFDGCTYEAIVFIFTVAAAAGLYSWTKKSIDDNIAHAIHVRKPTIVEENTANDPTSRQNS